MAHSRVQSYFVILAHSRVTLKTDCQVILFLFVFLIVLCLFFCVWLFAAFCCPQKDMTDNVTDTVRSGTKFPSI